MGAISIDVAKFGGDSVGSNKSLLTARPDMRIVSIGFLAAAVIAALGTVVYLLPISDSVKVAFLPLGVLFIVILGYSAILFEGLWNAVFTITNEYVEDHGGMIWKRQHHIPLSYVRDVTYSQNFLQAMFGVASVTISPTNGNNIMFSNIKNGEGTWRLLSKLVSANSP